MTEESGRTKILYPLGVTPVEGGAAILVQAEGTDVKLLLYRAGEKEVWKTVDFKEENRVGNVWSMFLREEGLDGLEYQFQADGRIFSDPCAKNVTGRAVWGDMERAGKPDRCRFAWESFDWAGDKKPEIPYSETILYRLHVRGFTKHPSSGVKARGSFSGVREKIPYLKDLGITSVELMPVTEFEEVMTARDERSGEEYPTGRINYWGYGSSYLFAVKSAYKSAASASAEREFMELVKALHREGMECILEFYFTGKEPAARVLEALRFWVEEYHVDGFHLSGFAPIALIAADPFLKATKLFAADWGPAFEGQRGSGYPAPGGGIVPVREKNLAEYNAGFQDVMRRFLKGDEGMIQEFMYRARRNPADFAVINYMANTNGFSLMDLVSYDRKHNEENGEENRDGSDYNYSWNCGEEGPSRKKKIAALRKKQLKNALLLLFLSQGTPLLLAGDEFGNTQKGNNNAYCQDNEISWLNWKLLKTNAWLYGFVRALIAFRKRHPLFHMAREPRLMDYKSCGRPDLSYHGENAWKPEYENFRRQLGMLYWGPYGEWEEKSADDTFYVVYNMHWEPHTFGLPRLPKGQLWHVVCDTSKETENLDGGAEPVLENQTHAVLPPRSILVLCSRANGGCYTYETAIGEITVGCEDGALVSLDFGRVPSGAKLPEARTELSDRVFEELQEYFAGERTEFDLPLKAEGTEFQKKVWNALLTIPYGETRSYKEIAAQIGEEKASRAVGMANNKNPIAILIPCHRVVGADGSLTGYAGGLEIKKKLLKLEQEKKKNSGE